MDSPRDTYRLTSDSAFINSGLFGDWLTQFKNCVTPTEDGPVLILDDHMSQCSLAAVPLWCLYPHSTHKLQPIDRGFFETRKTAYAAEADKLMHNYHGLQLHGVICLIFRNAYEIFTSMKIAKRRVSN
jgi:hypothetical protein